jgi:NADH-quinone oxidoreductase subunit J
MPLWLFTFLAVIAIIGAFGVILQRSPVHCLLALALTLVDVGVLFVGLGAVTLGFLQIIIYVGAIMVLFLFVIWLLNLQSEAKPNGHLALKFFGSIGAAALAAELSVFFFSAQPISRVTSIPPGYGSVEDLARMLFSDYLVAFEVTSILLLAALAGAIALARRVPGAALLRTPAEIQRAARPGSTVR